MIAVAVFLLILIAAYAVNASHNTYKNGFNLSINNQSSYFSNGNIIYNAVLSYNALSNSTVYFTLYAVYNGTSGYLGLYNSSLLKSNPPCQIRCVNQNKIRLNNTLGTYLINATAQSLNTTNVRLQAVLYNRQYFYASQPVNVK